jgi:hypothetical protein
MRYKTVFVAVPLPAAVSGALAVSGSVMVGAQTGCPSKDIVDNALNSAAHATLVTDVKAARTSPGAMASSW